MAERPPWRNAAVKNPGADCPTASPPCACGANNATETADPGANVTPTGIRDAKVAPAGERRCPHVPYLAAPACAWSITHPKRLIPMRKWPRLADGVAFRPSCSPPACAGSITHPKRPTPMRKWPRLASPLRKWSRLAGGRMLRGAGATRAEECGRMRTDAAHQRTPPWADARRRYVRPSGRAVLRPRATSGRGRRARHPTIRRSR